MPVAGDRASTMPAAVRPPKLVFSPAFSVLDPTVFLNPVVNCRPVGSGSDLQRHLVTYETRRASEQGREPGHRRRITSHGIPAVRSTPLSHLPRQAASRTSEQ